MWRRGIEEEGDCGGGDRGGGGLWRRGIVQDEEGVVEDEEGVMEEDGGGRDGLWMRWFVEEGDCGGRALWRRMVEGGGGDCGRV